MWPNIIFKYYLKTETKNILDTKIASKLARSYSDSHSLKTLIKEFLNIDAAITLIMFGILLGLIRINFKTISYGIGIHSGFVFTIKTFKSNSSLNLDSDYIHLLSNYDKFTGHLSTIWITTLILLYMIFIYKKK